MTASTTPPDRPSLAGALLAGYPLVLAGRSFRALFLLLLLAGTASGMAMSYVSVWASETFAIGPQAVAMLFVHKASIDAPSPPEVIAKTYHLTPTELRVLLGIVEVGGVPEVAETLGIAETTVKTHLGRLYEKTGASRQADLVKLFAGFRNPFMAGT